MKKLFRYSFFLVLIFASHLFAQYATVSGNVTDASGQIWAGGTWTLVFQAPPYNPQTPAFQGSTTFTKSFSGALNSLGSYTVSNVPRSDYITPAGTYWILTVCPAATAACFTAAPSTINSSSFTYNATPPAINIKPNPAGFSSAYSDSELQGGAPGTLYFNLTDSNYHVCVTGNPCTSWGIITSNNGNPTFGNLTAQSVNGVLNAAQFSGGDPGAQINAAEAALPAAGGTIDATTFVGTQTITTPIVLTKPTILELGYTQFDCSSIDIASTPCIRFETSGSSLIGPNMVGAGPVASGYAMILWKGDPTGAGAIVQFYQSSTSQIAYCTVKNIYINMIETGTETPGSVPNIQGVEFINPVFDRVVNLYVHHDSVNYTPRDATNDSTQGLVFTTSYSGEVPPAGFSSVTNYLDTNDDSSGPEQSAGTITGSAGLLITHGTGDDSLNAMAINGPCNIEDVAYGIKIDGAEGTKISNGCFLQTYPWGIYLDGAQVNEFDFLKVNLNSVSGNAAYYIDSASYDNQFRDSSFYGAASGQVSYGTDSGIRTTWDNTSSGAVNPVYLAGPIGGQAATSTANVNSYSPTFSGNYWNGSTDASCNIAEGLAMGTGSNPSMTFGFTPSGCYAGYPVYSFTGSNLQLLSTGGSLAWEAVNNGISEQLGDARIDANSLSSPTAWFDIGGTPTAEDAVTIPDASAITLAGQNYNNTFTGGQTFSNRINIAVGASGSPDGSYSPVTSNNFVQVTPSWNYTDTQSITNANWDASNILYNDNIEDNATNDIGSDIRVASVFSGTVAGNYNGILINPTDSTTLANTDTGLYVNMTNTGNANATKYAAQFIGAPVLTSSIDNGTYTGAPVVNIVSGTLSVTPSASVGCTDTTATATGAATTDLVSVTPQSVPSADTNISWQGYVSAANTVDIHVCTIVALTASAITFNWTVHN